MIPSTSQFGAPVVYFRGSMDNDSFQFFVFTDGEGGVLVAQLFLVRVKE